MTKIVLVPVLGADPQQLVLQPLAGHLVERAERLVHQQQRRVYGQRPRDRDPLLHAAGELGRVVPGELAQPDQVEHLPRPVPPLAPGRRRAAPAAARRCAAPCATRRGRPAGRRCRTPGRAGPAGPACRRPSPCRSVGGIRSATSRSSVDLPQPDGPISETNWPRSTVRSIVGQRGDLVGPAGVEDLASHPSRSTASVMRLPLRLGRADGGSRTVSSSAADERGDRQAEQRPRRSSRCRPSPGSVVASREYSMISRPMPPRVPVEISPTTAPTTAAAPASRRAGKGRASRPAAAA